MNFPTPSYCWGQTGSLTCISHVLDGVYLQLNGNIHFCGTGGTKPKKDDQHEKIHIMFLSPSYTQEFEIYMSACMSQMYMQEILFENVKLQIKVCFEKNHMSTPLPLFNYRFQKPINIVDQQKGKQEWSSSQTSIIQKCINTKEYLKQKVIVIKG